MLPMKTEKKERLQVAYNCAHAHRWAPVYHKEASDSSVLHIPDVNIRYVTRIVADGFAYLPIL